MSEAAASELRIARRWLALSRSTGSAAGSSTEVCPAANRVAAAFRAANSPSWWAEPMCSIERNRLRQDHTTCTAVAPEDVFTVRTYGTRAAYGPILVFKFHPKREQTPATAPTART
jgi:hypothetical protein